MSTLSIRIPDDKYSRLKSLAASRQISINKLFDELSTQALSEFDIRTQFELRASRGSAARGLDALSKLEQLDASNSQ